MVSLRMMGWGLVLLENSSVVAAAVGAVAAVTAAAVAAAAVAAAAVAAAPVAAAAVAAAAVAAAAVAVGVDHQKVGFCIKNIEYGHFSKGVFSENTLYTFVWVCWRGLDGPRPLKLRYLARSTTVLTFHFFGKNNRPA